MVKKLVKKRISSINTIESMAGRCYAYCTNCAGGGSFKVQEGSYKASLVRIGGSY